MYKIKYITIGFLMLLTTNIVKSQSNLIVDTTFTAEQLIKKVLLQGNNVKVDNIRYNGHPSAVGHFEIDQERNFKLENGIILSSGRVSSSIGPNSSPSLSDTLGRGGDKDLQKLGQRRTYDAAVLEFDFVPLNNKVSFTYIFASEEYLEYSGSKYNDVFAFFISGPGIKDLKNMATLPRIDEVVSINTINQFKNQDYFVNNNNWRIDGKEKADYELGMLNKDLQEDLEYDGMTIALKAETNVIPYKKYHFKIAIADVSDMRYNSAVFLKGGSFTAEIDTTATGVFSFVENVDTNKVDFEAIFKNKAFDIADAQIKIKESIIPTDIPTEYNTEVSTLQGDEIEKALKTKEEITFSASNMVLALPSKFKSISFNYNSDILTEEAKTSLNILVQMLNATPSAQTYLTGHTDATGSNQYNITLSHMRVKAVYDYLKSQGIDISRLKTAHFGETQPKTTNQSEAGRAENRRVEILLKKV